MARSQVYKPFQKKEKKLTPNHQNVTSNNKSQFHQYWCFHKIHSSKVLTLYDNL